AGLAGVIAAGAPDEGTRPPGTLIDGAPVVPLHPGAMTLLLDQEGRARVERWEAGSEAWSARQGVALVDGGRVAEEARSAARSVAKLRGAIGVDARGDLLYAVSNSAWPAAVGEALADAGALRAVALGPGM